MKLRFFKNKYRDVEIAPDEIFLDSKNLPNFNTQQFEGRIEKPIGKQVVVLLGVFFLFFGGAFIWKLGVLQIHQGEAYLKKSESNTLAKQPIFADRGLIYDRNGKLLAWNTWDIQSGKFEAPTRTYTSLSGFAHVLGYVSVPAKDAKGVYWQDGFIGKDGVEKFYDKRLQGKNGVRITETDVKGVVQSENIVSPPSPGDALYLSVDADIQNKLYSYIADMSRSVGFSGGAGVLMEINSGEVLALTSYPEYNPAVLSLGKDKQVISGYLTDNRKVFLNRAVNGLYTPGSIVKPFVGYGALVENVISPFKVILSNGSIEIPNPYFPEKKSVFKDHGVFGYVDMKKAIAVSSDVYFYAIGGGFKDQKGLGIVKIDDYARIFGIASKTGIDLSGEKEGNIPTPEWKIKTFKGDPWRVGDTYNTSIGQYGFQVTPIQMVRATASIVNGGNLVTPHLLHNDKDMEKKKSTIKIDEEKMKYIREGMRMAVTEGTAMSLNLPNVKVAAKSGTAQVGLGNTNTNSWIIGFFPYENPKYAFVVMMERGPKAASGNATRVASQMIDYMTIYKPEYFK